ncbi:hypothetical protein GCM10011608_10710 [Micromonospora sonchi]|uniref:Uncharacterized protein n=1 Tax=Micromonospora sonchi TaxID=1763543 RepID=A0A917TM26_9ACTN|nr:hypothetical protein [Micromonospora sonchi]GGM27751.1 hypothetical protein GCM10011608_10710 [Micromonospora sonchi]
MWDQVITVKAHELRKNDRLVSTAHRNYPAGIIVTRTRVATDGHTVGAWLKGFPKRSLTQFGGNDDVQIIRPA